MATQLITAVNSIHNSITSTTGDAFDLNGNASAIDFFSGSDASTIAVNPLIHDDTNPLNDNPSLIAAAATVHSVFPLVANPSDGAKALQIADLANTGVAALGGQTFTQYLSTTTAALGSTVKSCTDQATQDNAVVSSLQDSIQQETGVNLDDEMVNMMSAQRAYQASVRVLTTVDGMLDVIINKIG